MLNEEDIKEKVNHIDKNLYDEVIEIHDHYYKNLIKSIISH